MNDFVDMPKFKNVFLPYVYSRADDEPLKFLDRIYPFLKITPENEYYYECLLVYFSSETMRYILPLLLDYLLEFDLDFSSNLLPSFEGFVFERNFQLQQIEFLKKMHKSERQFILSKLNKIITKKTQLRFPPEEIEGLIAWKLMLST